MKILLVEIGNVIGAQGGVERVLANMANAMDGRGHKVTILTYDENSGSLYFTLNEHVDFVNLGVGKHVSRTWINIRNLFVKDKWKREKNRLYNRCKFMNQEIQKFVDKLHPDVVVGYETNGIVLFTKFVKLKVPFIVMFHSTPMAILENRYLFDSFRKADCLQVLLPEDIEEVNNILPDAKKIVCIGNAVPSWQEITDFGNKKIITISHVEPNVKRPHLIVEAFAKIAKQFSEWTLEIWGNDEYDSEYTAQIRNFIENNKLEKQVKLCGVTNAIKDKLLQASIFITTSKFEGFHLGMAEAMSLGLVPIGLKNCSGVNKLIKDSKNGFLVEETLDDLANKMKSLMLDKDLREKLGKRAKGDMQMYAPMIIWDQWEHLFAEVIEKC